MSSGAALADVQKRLVLIDALVSTATSTTAVAHTAARTA